MPPSPDTSGRTFVPWRASTSHLNDLSVFAALRHTPHGSDWWTSAVAPVAFLHLSLFLTLQARPGAIAPNLWIWGPPMVLTLTAALLMAAFVSALRGRSWSTRRAVAFAGLCAVVATLPLYQTFPSAYDEHPSAIDMHLPLDGAVTVVWGGSTPRANYHVGTPAERWAYDLVVTIDGRSHAGDGRALSDYYAYDRPVQSPAGGRVVVVHDGDSDAVPRHPERRRGGGNRIVIEIAPRQFLFLVHLRPGSIRVAPGDWIRQGDIVARVGNSGNSTEPHLHLHVQDEPVPGAGQGVPFYFSNYVTVRDGKVVTQGMPAGGVRRGRFVGEIVASGTPQTERPGARALQRP